MSLDIDVLQHELQAIRSERETAHERIQFFSHRGRGRGRGRGLFPGRGSLRQPEDLAGRDAPPQSEQPVEGGSEQDAPPSRSGLSARLSARLGGGGSEEGSGPNGLPQRPHFGSFKRADQHDFRLRREEFRDRHFSRESYDVPMEDAEVPLPGSNTGRLASAVKVERAQQDFMEPRKRPTENGPVNPAQQKRAKRLFGSLLGTLQKFQEEDSRFKRTKLAQDRAEAESRAEQRAQQESFKMREKQRLDIANARVSEINKKRELDMQLQIKEREIDVARMVAQEMALTKWLKTGCGPPIMWLPRKHNQDTLLLLEQRQVDVTAWEAAQVEKLEKEKKQMLERLTFISPRPPPDFKEKAEEAPAGDTEMEPGEAAQDTANQEDAQMERFEAEEGEDMATDEAQGDGMDVKEESG